MTVAHAVGGFANFEFVFSVIAIMHHKMVFQPHHEGLVFTDVLAEILVSLGLLHGGVQLFSLVMTLFFSGPTVH